MSPTHKTQLTYQFIPAAEFSLTLGIFSVQLRYEAAEGDENFESGFTTTR
jgi:hypothetical protein